ncbi:tyrosine-type recombinase/integrase [Photobacterium swingsii]|uniref:tyrosine-type recombinase/integrase n=1 Tax=Photobacterium swingsii TaxID=680026 RepID=UPI00352D1F59
MQTKNIIKRELKRKDGQMFFSFSHKGGRSIRELDDHINKMISVGVPANTVIAKAQDLARFYDYFIEASNALLSEDYKRYKAINDHHDEVSELLRTPLATIIEGFPTFLAFGSRSNNVLSSYCAQRLDSKTLKESSIRRILSSVREFTKASALVEASIYALNADNLIDVDVSKGVFGEQLLKRRELTGQEKKSLLKNSFLYGCISGGAKYTTDTSGFVVPNMANDEPEKEKCFPMAHVVTFLNAAPSYRDKAIYALIFGGGLRPSEAYSLKFQDVHIEQYSPSATIKDPSGIRLSDLNTQRYLEARNYRKYGRKGTKHFNVFMLEPMKSFFFDAYEAYLKYERPETDETDFIFMTSRKVKDDVTGSHDYIPYFQTSQQTKQDAFKDNLKRIGLGHLELGPHSGRHFYGTFLLNFAPNDKGGFGYELEEVQEHMRHSSRTSTDVYAKLDPTVKALIMQTTNNVLELNDGDLTKVRDLAIENNIKELFLG